MNNDTTRPLANLTLPGATRYSMQRVLETPTGWLLQEWHLHKPGSQMEWGPDQLTAFLRALPRPLLWDALGLPTAQEVGEVADELTRRNGPCPNPDWCPGCTDACLLRGMDPAAYRRLCVEQGQARGYDGTTVPLPPCIEVPRQSYKALWNDTFGTYLCAYCGYEAHTHDHIDGQLWCIPKLLAEARTERHRRGAKALGADSDTPYQGEDDAL